MSSFNVVNGDPDVPTASLSRQHHPPPISVPSKLGTSAVTTTTQISSSDSPLTSTESPPQTSPPPEPRRDSLAGTLLGKVTGILHGAGASASTTPSPSTNGTSQKSSQRNSTSSSAAHHLHTGGSASHSGAGTPRGSITPAIGTPLLNAQTVGGTHAATHAGGPHTIKDELLPPHLVLQSSMGSPSLAPGPATPTTSNPMRSPSVYSIHSQALTHTQSHNRSSSAVCLPVKETNRVILEYDPLTRRKVLNTYEILREIGRGEHGKVKLARDLESGELVAIKIVNRNSRKSRPSFKRRADSHLAEGHAGGAGATAHPQKNLNEYELKIKREIAIMKKCSHKHIVRLKEVLDDVKSYKIYLVLEYLEKGEIKWKRKLNEKHQQQPGSIAHNYASPTSPPSLGGIPESQSAAAASDDIPCCGQTDRKTSISFGNSVDEDEDVNHLLSDQYTPNLTFRQARKILRHVILGLEYLHLQGIVHRDIKPANLLVSLNNIVKISDFGVSFASSLTRNDEGFLVSEMELAKTAGTPAFFAPELCQTNFPTPNSSTTSMAGGDHTEAAVPKVDHKIDIWALGVTLYCILFGKVPFYADSEFKLFQVIVNEPLKFPESHDSFNSPCPVSPEEFDLAKDLLTKLLDKNRKTRIDIPDIKRHPFVLMDLENDIESLHEFVYSNEQTEIASADRVEIDNAVVGIGSRIRRSLVNALRQGNSEDIKRRISQSGGGHSGNSHSGGGSGDFYSSDDESGSGSGSASGGAGTATGTATPTANYGYVSSNSGGGFARSVILSESLSISTPPQLQSSLASNATTSGNVSDLSLLTKTSSQPSQHQPSQPVRTFLQEMIESQSSAGSSRRGSATAIAEAPMVETKRNVGGDLYLKNQSALEAFKGIQQKDDKRRRSSAFTSPPQSQPPAAKNSVSFEEPLGVNSTSHQSQQGPGQHLKVRPMNIENPRRPASIISLPLSESFASLDSFSDDYLSQNYFPESKHHHNQFSKSRRRSSSTSDMYSGGSNGGSAAGTTEAAAAAAATADDSTNISHINESFKKFDLGYSMKPRAQPQGGAKLGWKDPEREIEPTTAIRNGNSSNDHRVSVSSYSSVSSSSSSSSSSEDSEDEDLTLAFSSKMMPSARPHFLSASNRAKSHDSHLPRLANHTANIYENIPIVFGAQGTEFEDVPAALMGNVPRVSVSNGSSSMGPSISILSSNTSSATITPGGPSPQASAANSAVAAATPVTPKTRLEPAFEAAEGPKASPLSGPGYSHIDAGGDSGSSPTPSGVMTPNTKFNKMQKEFYSRTDRASSPLVNNAPSADNATVNSHLVSAFAHGEPRNPSYLSSQFNNHYKKDPIAFPFPNALHLDADRESISKSNTKGEPRPQHYRSSSVTVGLLQLHKHKDPDTEAP